MILDRPDLGGWNDLPFWETGFPAVQAALARDDRAIYPSRDRVFRALDALQPEDVRVVILGQDPYHTPGKADGLAFSIPQGFGGRLDSMGNILAEIEADLGRPRTRTDLVDWAAQGVLLLNTALTVPEGQAKGHAKLGWSALTRDVLHHLSDRPRAFLLWGNPARAFARHIAGDHHLILQSGHPSPLSVRHFRGTRPFGAVNAWLRARGESPITWSDP